MLRGWREERVSIGGSHRFVANDGQRIHFNGTPKVPSQRRLFTNDAVERHGTRCPCPVCGRFASAAFAAVGAVGRYYAEDAAAGSVEGEVLILRIHGVARERVYHAGIAVHSPARRAIVVGVVGVATPIVSLWTSAAVQ